MEARKLEEIEDGLLIDPDTGEITNVAFDAISESTPADVKVDALPKLARVMRSVQRQIDRLSEYQKSEVERVISITQQRMDSLTGQYNRLLDISEGMFCATGEKRIEYPGLGVFRRVKGRESVNSDEYDAMPDETKRSVQSAWSNYFTTKVVVTPNKKDILVGLKEGTPIDGFSVNEAGDKFEFKGE